MRAYVEEFNATSNNVALVLRTYVHSGHGISEHDFSYLRIRQ